MLIEHDHTTGVTRIRPEPGDCPEERRSALEFFAELCAVVRGTLSVPTHVEQPQAELLTRPSSSRAASAATSPIAPAQGPWLSDVALAFRDFHIKRKLWKTRTTWTNCYEPILRVARELVSHQTRKVSWADLEGDMHEAVVSDIPVRTIHRALIVQLSEDLFKFPGRHGKRPTAKDAKLILAGGGDAQSSKNARKMMERFATFLHWAADNGYIDAALASQAAVLCRGGDDEDGGARAFDQLRLRKIFESLSYRQDTFKRAYSYWSPLLALFTGGRIAELAGLTVEDFVEVTASHVSGSATRRSLWTALRTNVE